MMQQLRNPKNVKMISLFVAAIFVLSCFAVTLQQGAFTSIASARLLNPQSAWLITRCFWHSPRILPVCRMP